MTEEEWLTSESPVAMLALINVDGYSRKLLLYASAVCALRPDSLTQRLHLWHATVESVLRDSDEPSSLDHNQEWMEDDCWHFMRNGSPDERAFFSVLFHVVACTWISDPRELDTPPPDVPEVLPLRRLGASYIRDIFGNPFRPVSFAPSWRTDNSLSLAQQMYDSRDFGAMPILADALQDAGCDNDDILAHRRDTSVTHVRGCWVVDLVLGKS